MNLSLAGAFYRVDIRDPLALDAQVSVMGLVNSLELRVTYRTHTLACACTSVLNWAFVPANEGHPIRPLSAYEPGRT